MQRVGRINRVDTKHDQVHTYTFFPTDQSNDQIKLKEAAEAKIAAFILGSDARLLTDSEEVEAHSLFSELLSKETIEGQDEPDSELKYLEIRLLRDENPALFEKVKRLPKSANGAKIRDFSFKFANIFSQGKVAKFFRIKALIMVMSQELDFLQAVHVLKADKRTTIKLDKTFYKLLEKNSETLARLTEIEEEEFSAKRGNRDNAARLSKILKSKQIEIFKDLRTMMKNILEVSLVSLMLVGSPRKFQNEFMRN